MFESHSCVRSSVSLNAAGKGTEWKCQYSKWKYGHVWMYLRCIIGGTRHFFEGPNALVIGMYCKPCYAGQLVPWSTVESPGCCKPCYATGQLVPWSTLLQCLRAPCGSLSRHRETRLKGSEVDQRYGSPWRLHIEQRVGSSLKTKKNRQTYRGRVSKKQEIYIRGR